MSDYYLSPVGEAQEEKLNQGCWIMLYHADEIPPHLILILEGKYYSLSVRGSKYGESFESLWRHLQNKQSKCLFFSVDLSSSRIQNKQELVQSHFEYFVAPQEGEITCLYPIRTALTELLNIYLENCHYVFELFHSLKNKNLSTEFLQLNITTLLDDQQGFELVTYDRASIDRCIAGLKIKEVHVEG